MMKRTKDIAEFVNLSRDNGDWRVFGFDDENLRQYLNWASNYNYLFVDSDEYGITGIGIAYPVKKKFDGTEKWFFTFKPVPSPEEEASCDICIMDFVAITDKARANIIELFKARYTSWESQEKYALIRGAPKKVSNKLIELLN